MAIEAEGHGQRGTGVEQSEIIGARPRVNAAAAKTTPPSAPTTEATPRDSNAIAAEILTRWQAPIEFYGKVIDENSNAVPGAKVSFHWVETPTESGNKTATIESDDAGMFSLHGQHGPNLDVAVSKEGYYTSQRGQQVFKYGFFSDQSFSPDPQNPIVFKLQKKGKGEPLVTVNYPGLGRIAQLRGDGTPIEIDLFKGEKAAFGGGQLKLEFWRGDNAKPNSKFDWKCQLSIPGGGLFETEQEFAIQAPQNGYQSSAFIIMPATSQDWQGEVRRKYYIHTADGRYGCIEFYLLSRNGVFKLSSSVNPSGSRNLEASN